MQFYDIPENERFAHRHIVETLGGEIRYINNGIQVSMPNIYKNRQAISTYLETIGMSEIDTSYFPLGSDNPPDIQKHRFMQKETDFPSYYLYSTFKFNEVQNETI